MPRTPNPCGTPGTGGARRHRKHQEPVCPACAQAEATYHLQYRATRKRRRKHQQ